MKITDNRGKNDTEFSGFIKCKLFVIVVKMDQNLLNLMDTKAERICETDILFIWILQWEIIYYYFFANLVYSGNMLL